jgi:hypothetical protein
MAALQLGEEIREIHGGALPCFDMDIFATSAGDCGRRSFPYTMKRFRARRCGNIA